MNETNLRTGGSNAGKGSRPPGGGRHVGRPGGSGSTGSRPSSNSSRPAGGPSGGGQPPRSGMSQPNSRETLFGGGQPPRGGRPTPPPPPGGGRSTPPPPPGGGRPPFGGGRPPQPPPYGGSRPRSRRGSCFGYVMATIVVVVILIFAIKSRFGGGDQAYTNEYMQEQSVELRDN